MKCLMGCYRLLIFTFFILPKIKGKKQMAKNEEMYTSVPISEHLFYAEAFAMQARPRV